MTQGAQAIYPRNLPGINAPLNINYLLAASALTKNVIKLTQVRFPTTPIPGPQVAQELAEGKIDATATPDPFATSAEQKYGAVEQSPVQGHLVTKAQAKQDPGTSGHSPPHKVRI